MGEMAEESKTRISHWADQVVKDVIDRVEQDEFLKEMVDKHGYIVYDEKTPSGKIHIGAGRGWIIHDVIAKAMRDQGLNAKFILSSDDIDPFDKMNSDLDPSYEKYLGVPFRDMPSPVDGYKSFADYYFTQCTDKFEEFGIEAEFESTGEQYANGAFNETIKIALDNADKIKEIYYRLYGDTIGSKRLPFNPICEKCGKIGTTIATEWDSEREIIKYKCMEDLVPWAKGCGYEGERSPYDGGGKFPWKVEWATKWPTKKVICEYAGKDHFTKGGSRTIAIAIANEVFNFPPPYPSTKFATGKGYEFFTVGGKKMSTSKGRGIGFVDSTQYAPAKMLRYMLVRTRPHAVIDFDPYNGNDLMLLYDRFDRTERIYYGEEKCDENTYLNSRRIYELSSIGKLWERMPPQAPLSHLAVVAQISPDLDNALEMLKASGHIEAPDDEEKEYIKDRLDFAYRWVNEFAPDQYKFTLRETPTKMSISDSERKALNELVNALESDIDARSLHDKIYEIAKGNGMKPSEFFSLCYKILIDREKGPRLASFLIMIKEQAVRLLKN
ncbi:lysine--tRNA ligase [Candidatus Woesearchaeota archaeon]|nr:lysine--tRNA ligase [Candidatus Woesearchaeota archaeon]